MMSYDFYLKKLTTQELGYRNGKLVTGAYFYISKQAISSFFPSLDKNILNNNLELDFIDADTFLNKLSANYVYHNDKFCKDQGTRDEYRIYINRDICPHDMYIRPNDIIVFKKVNEKEYIFKVLKPFLEEYSQFEILISESKQKGNHALLTMKEYHQFLTDLH